MRRLFFSFFLLFAITGCFAVPKPAEKPGHPRIQVTDARPHKIEKGAWIRKVTDTRMDEWDQIRVFQARFSLKGHYHRLVVQSKRCVQSSYFQGIDLADPCEIKRVKTGFTLNVLIDPRKGRDTEQHPLRVNLYHRTHQGWREDLAEWWIIGEKVYTSRPRQTTKPFLSVASGTANLLAPRE